MPVSRTAPILSGGHETTHGTPCLVPRRPHCEAIAPGTSLLFTVWCNATLQQGHNRREDNGGSKTLGFRGHALPFPHAGSQQMAHRIPPATHWRERFPVQDTTAAAVLHGLWQKTAVPTGHEAVVRRANLMWTGSSGFIQCILFTIGAFILLGHGEHSVLFFQDIGQWK
jgi:hypothetical protein